MLPFSKGVASAAYVLLLILSCCKAVFKNRFFQTPVVQQVKIPNTALAMKDSVLFMPLLLFIMLVISLSYTGAIKEGIRLVISQSKMIGLPFIFLINYSLISQKKETYLGLFIRAVALAALITFIFFLLPTQVVASIADTITPLKDYIAHEKTFAFGAYSPFLDRLQFSYLLSGAFFLALWRQFNFRTSDKKMVKGFENVSDTLKVSDTLAKSLKTSLLNSIYLLVLLLCLVILGARGAQLGFIIGSAIWLVGIYFYYCHPVLKNKVGSLLSYSIVGLGLLTTTCGLPWLVYKKVPAVKMRYDQLMWEVGTFQDGTFQQYDYFYFTSMRRLLSWKNSWKVIQTQPILGTGIGDYEAGMQEIYQQDNLGFPVNTHSQLLYYWASAGIFGIGLFLLLWGHWLYHLIKTKDYWITILASSFFAFYTFVFLLDAPLNFQVGAMTFWFFYAFVRLLGKRETSNSL